MRVFFCLWNEEIKTLVLLRCIKLAVNDTIAHQNRSDQRTEYNIIIFIKSIVVRLEWECAINFAAERSYEWRKRKVHFLQVKLSKPEKKFHIFHWTHLVTTTPQRWIKIQIRRAIIATTTFRATATAIHREIPSFSHGHAWFAHADWNFSMLGHFKSIWKQHIPKCLRRRQRQSISNEINKHTINFHKFGDNEAKTINSRKSKRNVPLKANSHCFVVLFFSLVPKICQVFSSFFIHTVCSENFSHWLNKDEY